MQLTTRLPKRRGSPRPTRTQPASPDGPSRRPAPAPEPPPAARRGGGGLEDRAFYACMCGYAFTASVTTSVGCPHCGTEQAW